MTTYEEIVSRISLLDDDELCEVFERCSNLYHDRQRIKRGILKKQLTDKLLPVLNEIFNNNFTISIENYDTDIHSPYHNVVLSPDNHYEVKLD